MTKEYHEQVQLLLDESQEHVIIRGEIHGAPVVLIKAACVWAGGNDYWISLANQKWLLKDSILSKFVRTYNADPGSQFTSTETFIPIDQIESLAFDEKAYKAFQDMVNGLHEYPLIDEFIYSDLVYEGAGEFMATTYGPQLAQEFSEFLYKNLPEDRIDPKLEITGAMFESAMSWLYQRYNLHISDEYGTKDLQYNITPKDLANELGQAFIDWSQQANYGGGPYLLPANNLTVNTFIENYHVLLEADTVTQNESLQHMLDDIEANVGVSYVAKIRSPLSPDINALDVTGGIITCETVTYFADLQRWQISNKTARTAPASLDFFVLFQWEYNLVTNKSVLTPHTVWCGSYIKDYRDEDKKIINPPSWDAITNDIKNWLLAQGL